jgi:hypothetical protein
MRHDRAQPFSLPQALHRGTAGFLMTACDDRAVIWKHGAWPVGCRNAGAIAVCSAVETQPRQGR